MAAFRGNQAETSRRDVTLRATADDLDGIIAEAVAGKNIVLMLDGQREAVLMSWVAWERLSGSLSFEPCWRVLQWETATWIVSAGLSLRHREDR